MVDATMVDETIVGAMVDMTNATMVDVIIIDATDNG